MSTWPALASRLEMCGPAVVALRAMEDRCLACGSELAVNGALCDDCQARAKGPAPP